MASSSSIESCGFSVVKDAVVSTSKASVIDDVGVSSPSSSFESQASSSSAIASLVASFGALVVSPR